VIRRIEEEQDLDDGLRVDMDELLRQFSERFL